MNIVKVWKSAKDTTILALLFIMFILIAYTRNKDNMPGLVGMVVWSGLWA